MQHDRRVQHPNATPRVEEALVRRPAGEVTVNDIAKATELPRDLVSTIMGRIARDGDGRLQRLADNGSGCFDWQPSRTLRPVAPLPVRGRSRPAARLADTDFVAMTDIPTQEGYWVIFGCQTSRPYKVVPL